MISDKTALITGGAKRLGREIALGLAQHGCDVIIHYNTSKSAAELLRGEIQNFGRKAWTIQGDLTSPEETETLFEKALQIVDRVDILINNASIFPRVDFWTTSASHITQNVQINAVSAFLLSRAFARQKHSGHIINMLDCRIVDYDTEHMPYHLSKRMLFTLTRIMAKEFAPSIQVNAIAPGLILPPEGKDKTYLEELAHTNLLNRYGNPQDIVRAVLFLLESNFITGQVIFVDGGRHMMGNFYG